ncbi:MAG: threonine/homoserine/homoserine lactone efflux protein [Phenylobacterium sp.]|jgi:threonine/homoserine/homoserine lactone efflux protein
MLAAMQPYWYEFLLIATAHLVAVASPGPDFAVVLKHSITYGRRCAIYTSLGVGAAIMLHITYTLIGIGILITQTPWVFDLFKYAAAAYLCYIGFSAIRSAPPKAQATDKSEQADSEVKTADGYSELSNKRAFWMGFLTNGLNPKATLFFLSLFSVIVAADTPASIKLVYGVYMSLATAAWFSFLSMILSMTAVRTFLLQKGYLFDRLMGIILLSLAAKLVFS